MFNEIRGIAEAVTAGQVQPIIRFGVVEAVDVSGPVMVTIAGHPMPCLESYTTPTIGDVVVWLNHQSRAIALGRQSPGGA